VHSRKGKDHSVLHLDNVEAVKRLKMEHSTFVYFCCGVLAINEKLNGLRKVSYSGNRIKFWEDIWIVNRSLKEMYPRLYSNTVIKQGIQYGKWKDNNWGWELLWRREWFEQENLQVMTFFVGYWKDLIRQGKRGYMGMGTWRG